jgi:outer membrane lipoprotein SlyB
VKQGVLFMRSLLAVIILSLAISPTVYAKGCIKGAIVGGAAGSTVGHGKLGAAAGCVVGHHEANKADAEKTPPQTPGQSTK